MAARLLTLVALLVLVCYQPAITTAQKTASPDVLVIVQQPQLRGQAIAQKRANYMAARGYKGHPPKSAGNQWSVKGANFEGVGWRSNPDTPHKKVSTCRPSGRSGSQDDKSRKLLGDAVARSRFGTFRVRIWGR